MKQTLHITRTALLSLCVSSLLAFTAAYARTAPPKLQQAPGFYMQNIGQLQVLALFDGTVALPRQQLKQIAPKRVDSLLQQRYVPETPEGLQTAVNAYLVRRAGHTLLVDTGTAQCFGTGLGQVLPNLKAAGVSPDTVQDVLLTHAHPDHLCGLLDANAAMAYPKARIWIQRSELAYWLDPQQEARASELFKPLFGMARKALAPYQQAGLLQTFDVGDALPEGVRYLPAAGHTVGHSAFLIDGNAAGTNSDQQQLLLWGDVVHYHVVQFADPKATYEPDQNYAQSVHSRQQLLQQAAAHGWWLAGAHLPFPGIGHVARDGKGYRWIPTELTPQPQ
ncbi:MAG: MBL fold metallo-hydrolase [Comamonas sp.]|jgi:glyoxylase-like metal-dependent hydrolase (beta-lactamase superfamily II)|uniref:MBL fold metallo-hydrolase n=1 Tax=Comamonas sp. TaxID=34028 RepID=UPI00283725D3|nr:MBL fold metallo-hydrolase [Comamonas sp.]MDR0216596.1 MBL fold metallo-hydrolase [Comamonas sp.]